MTLASSSSRVSARVTHPRDMGESREKREVTVTPESVPNRRIVKSGSDAATDAHERPKDYLNEAEVVTGRRAADHG